MVKNYRLIWAREHAFFTQSQLAEKLRVSRSTIAKWESGEVQVTPRRWHEILGTINMLDSDIPTSAAADPTATAGTSHTLCALPPVSHLEYDEKGYPTIVSHLDEPSEDAHWESGYLGSGPAEVLERIEGVEYRMRDRRRYEIDVVRWSTRYTDGKQTPTEYIAAEMAQWDADWIKAYGPSSV